MKADQERYGESDLVCAIDYHNLAVTTLLAGDLDAALDCFQTSVFIKRKCLETNDTTTAVREPFVLLEQVIVQHTFFVYNSMKLLYFKITHSLTFFIHVPYRTHLLKLGLFFFIKGT